MGLKGQLGQFWPTSCDFVNGLFACFSLRITFPRKYDDFLSSILGGPFSKYGATWWIDGGGLPHFHRVGWGGG